MARIYHHNEPFTLECGAVLPELVIAYDTYGQMNADGSNVIWVCHALTANSDVADWWPHTVEKDKFLDPEKYFVVCANFLGSHYGTTGPLHVNPSTGRPWFSTFPDVTVRDMVRAHQILAKALGIGHINLLIGSSIGGFQCMEWAIMEPDICTNLALIATTPRTKPWASAFEESQRMIIENDPTWGNGTPEAGLEGMAVARSVALLSYRGGSAYDLSQEETVEDPNQVSFRRRVHSYQRHQAEKLKSRFNAYSYYLLSRTVDAHNIGRDRGRVEDVLKGIKARTVVVAITSDILFPPSDHTVFVENIPDVEYHLIDSAFGHDGFLVEHEQLGNIIKHFMKTL